jgi:hypothetical protein
MQPTETTFNIELLPKGCFLVTLENNQSVKGRFSIYALDRFCEKRKLTYMQAFTAIAVGLSLSDYAELTLFALQDYYREDVSQCPWSINRVMDDIMDPMGMGSDMSLSFFKHAIGRLATIKEQAEPAKNETDEEKKSELKSGTDSTENSMP